VKDPIGSGIRKERGTSPTGWYLIGEIGQAWPSLVGVTSIDPASFTHWVDETCPGEVTEALTSWLAGTEGFGATHCAARCNDCRGHWYAESGSWHFTPDLNTDEPAWDFDDADGFAEDNTITCPRCHTGRVAFAIT
jgi:hypothetical protein